MFIFRFWIVLFLFVQGTAAVANDVHRGAEDLLCHQTKSFLTALSANKGRLPNGLELKNGRPAGGSNLSQPRMLQFALNLWLLYDRLESNEAIAESNTCGSELKSLAVMTAISFFNESKYLSDPLPWKKDYAGSDNYAHHMDIYDVADWLTISTAYGIFLHRGSTIEKNSRISIYIKTVEAHVRRMLEGSFTRLVKPEPNRVQAATGIIPVGYTTLAVDSLMFVDHALNTTENVTLVSKILNAYVAMAVDGSLREDDRGAQSTTLMTYGEIFESMRLYRQVYGDDKLYKSQMKKMLYAVNRDFKVNDRFGYYHKESGKSNECTHVMSFEGFYTNLLNYATEENNKKLTVDTINNISAAIDRLKVPPMVENCGAVTSPNLAGFYALLKLMSNIELNSPEIQREFNEDILLNVLAYVQDQLRSNIFIKSNATDHQIEDISSNVWIYNEWLVPYVASTNWRLSNYDEFFGCNFIHIGLK